MATNKKDPAYLAELYGLGTKTGAPPKYATPEELRDKIQEYFDSLDVGDPPTISGLTLFCGFADRQSFYDYQKKGDNKTAGRSSEFSCVTRAARSVIAHFHEIGAVTSEKNSNGHIFLLKHFGFEEIKKIEDVTPDKKQTFKIGKTTIKF